MNVPLSHEKNHPRTDAERIQWLMREMAILKSRLDMAERQVVRDIHADAERFSQDPVAIARLEGVQVFPKGTDTDVIRDLAKRYGIEHMKRAINAVRGTGRAIYVSSVAQWMNDPANKPEKPASQRKINYDATRDHLAVHSPMDLKGAEKIRYTAARAKPTNQSAIDLLMAEYPHHRNKVLYYD